MTSKPSRLQRIRAAKTLDELYALVPKPVNCTGECWDSCGPIGYSIEEGERMSAAGHRPANVGEPRSRLMCSALTTENKCMVYEARPMICRLWGVSEVMPCNHGDCWTPFPLDTTETAALMSAAQRIGGDSDLTRQHYETRKSDLAELILRGRKEWNC